MNLQVFTCLETVEKQWRRFERVADCTVFQVYDWLKEWHRHIGSQHAVTPVIVLGHNVKEDLLFILPLAIETRRGVRRLVWLGSQLCDYHAPLLSPSYRDEVKQPFISIWREVLRIIRQRPDLRFDFIELSRMPSTVGSQPNPFLELPRIRASTFSSHLTDLPQDWDHFYNAKRSKSTRKKDRRALRQLARHGEVRFIEAVARADIDRTMTSLIHHKRLSYARMAVPDIFDVDGVENFYRAVATNPLLQEIVHISRLDVGQSPVATAFCLKFRGRYYSIMPTYDPVYAQYSPGRAHLHEMFRYAIKHNMDTFDFTIGDEAYKADWEDKIEPIFSYLDDITMIGTLVLKKRLVSQLIDSCYQRVSNQTVRRVLRKSRRQLRKWTLAAPSSSANVKAPILPSRTNSGGSEDH
ncbi:MAG: GNAT family N-acetyltransferase [Alphaproteobacteria bacterium]|nr:GNAT family N-acetyltransferase [Alphaproteobacteria bacterium]